MHGKSKFLEHAERLLVENGFSSSQLVSSEGNDQGETAVFAINGLLFRVVRDRSEEFLDIGTADRPDEFHQVDDIAVALGWYSVEDIWQRTKPEPLSSVIEFLRKRFYLMQRELLGSTGELTRAKINKARDSRAAALEGKLR